MSRMDWLAGACATFGVGAVVGAVVALLSSVGALTRHDALIIMAFTTVLSFAVGYVMVLVSRRVNSPRPRRKRRV